MALISLFKSPKNRKFEYKPRFYDEHKEEMQERLRKAEQELGIQHEGKYHIGITRGSIRHAHGDKTKIKKKTNIRFIVILLLLLAAAYFYLYK